MIRLVRYTFKESWCLRGQEVNTSLPYEMATRKANYSWLTLMEVWSQILGGDGSLLSCSVLVSIV